MATKETILTIGTECDSDDFSKTNIKQLTNVTHKYTIIEWTLVQPQPNKQNLKKISEILENNGTLLVHTDEKGGLPKNIDFLLAGMSKPTLSDDKNKFVWKSIKFSGSSSHPISSSTTALNTKPNIIDEDGLLRDEDKVKPVISQECGPNSVNKRACKDCSCGYAEASQQTGTTKSAPDVDGSLLKSSCGSCYLGDAFRCGGCPYRGMPAFKEGETVKLAFDEDDDL